VTFVWPWLLLSLVAIPVLVAGYRRLVRRRAARRTQLAALGLVAAGPSDGRRRHLVPTLFLGTLVLLCVALARPEATVAEPRRQGTVVLAFDVSSSMAAKDVSPSRIEAAKSAARAFVNKQPPTIRLAVVAFGQSGVISRQPTDDHAAVLAAIDRLAPQGGTALGRGIQTALSAIAGKTVRLDAPSASSEAQGQNIGYFGSAAVILLSDGENTDGPDPLQAAEFASTAGVRIYPVGLGSPTGTVLQIDGFQIATSLDEPLLRQIASRTDGTYFPAADAQTLTNVYSSIDLQWTVERKRTEVTSMFAALAGVLLLIGAGLSLARSGRVI
jgi:Ca-activated chloride channel homolog